MQRRVVHCYYVSGEDRTTLVIHFTHPKRISFKQLDAKMAEVWTLRKDV